MRSQEAAINFYIVVQVVISMILTENPHKEKITSTVSQEKSQAILKDLILFNIYDMLGWLGSKYFHGNRESLGCRKIQKP